MSVSSALGGSERSLLDFVRRAGQHRIAPVVILPKEGPLRDEVLRAGIPVEIAPASDRFLELSQRESLSWSGAVELVRGIASWSRAIAAAVSRRAGGGTPVRVLYSNGFKAHLACTFVPGVHSVWHLREFPPDGFGLVWRLLGGFVPTASIANSRAVARAWRWPALRPPAVVHNGVDLDLFTPHVKTFWVHEQLGIQHDHRLIGMPAVFARWKGHLQVVEAFERLAARAPDTHLVLVGGPIYDTVAERGYAEELVRRVGRSSLSGAKGVEKLNHRIHFLRFHPEPWRLYPEFDVVVHFSTRPEPFGRVVAEAMASGCVVVAAGSGGPAEIVEHGVTGWLTPAGDVAALAERLAAVLADDGEAMRTAARRAAEERFSADRYAEGVARVLHEAGR